MRNIYLLSMLCFFSLGAKAQRLLGVSTGNWNTTSSLYLNPASIADSRSRLTIDIATFNGFVDNDLGTINKTKFTDKLGKGKYVGMNSILDMGSKTTGNVMAPYGEFRGPGVTWNIDHKNSLAFTTRVRGVSQFTNIDKDIYRSVLDADYGKTNGNFTRTVTDFRWSTAAWGEIGATYGRVLIDEGRRFLSFGITARYLGGISYASLNGSSITADYRAASDSTRFTNTHLSYSGSLLNDSKAIKENSSVGQMLGAFFGKNGGSGIGADIGMSYEFRPDYEQYLYDMDSMKRIVDHSRPRYKLRLSAAITDIGAINFSGAGNKQIYATRSGYNRGNALNKNVFNFKDFRNFSKIHGFSIDTGKRRTFYYLPTALVLGADYKLGRGFYMNATYIGNLAKHDAIGTYYYSQLTVTPRFDSRTFSIGMPLTYSALSHSFKMGMGVCMAGFFIGSDDMLVLFSNKAYGANFYAGAFVPVNYKRPTDRDGDHVSDKKDLCPDVPGVWAFKGCPDPDKDRDGIPDSVDKCPNVPGVKSANGCPDKDGDGIADASDRCPAEAGTLALKGCPDRDGDGVVDIDDACPDQKGEAKYKGCPDTDGDGVADNLDKCPTVAGPATNNGCPVEKARVEEPDAESPDGDLKFETGKATLSRNAYPLLLKTAVLLNEQADVDLIIRGYTDNVGSDKQNLILSKVRANTVKKWFTNNGISPGRLEIHGMGSANPVGDNKTAAGRARNRRVTIVQRRK